jgi:hypothetical protein
MFRRRKQKQKTNKLNFSATEPGRKTLPPNFAEMVIQLEMDMNYSCNLNSLNQLIALYSEGIEYFECIGDGRYL